MPCDYAEHDDLGNGSAAETTTVDVGGRAIHVCGALDGGHYDQLLGSIDDDAYRITVDVSGPMLVQILGADLAVLDDVVVRFFDTATHPRLVGQGRFDPARAAHGAFLVDLDPGTYDMIVTARAGGDVTGALDYRIRLSAMPACAPISDPVDHVEGTGDNDAVAVDFSHDPSFAMMAGSAPEPTGLEIVAGEHYLIEGGITADPHPDEYLDRDTYELVTSDSANELAIRLDWDSDGSDLDYIVFEDGVTTPVVTSNLASTTSRELAMFPVKPGTRYWLWVGGFRGSNATVYRATVCGSRVFY